MSTQHAAPTTQRTLTVFAAGLIAATGVFLTYPGGLSAAYADVISFDINQSMLTEQQAIGNDLVVRSQAITERIELKEALVTDLVEGHATLADTAAKFHELNRDVPTCMSAIRMRYPEASDDERMVLNVLDFASIRDMDETERNTVMGRLAAEYETMFGHRYHPSH